ncbi:MAG: hypothetical protein HFH88_12280 [Lachnospiraceae bacterium]|nr:hypothetical protein [Lachnospiraceae bacterium]
MAVLSYDDIVRLIKKEEGILILNRRDKNISGLGYDLTIGFIRDADTGQVPETFAEDNNRYVLLSEHRYIVISKEFVYFSSQYMATLHSRGSYALKGIIVTSTTVDPNYAGCITGSLYICSPKDVYIKKDNSFATMVIHQLRTPTQKGLSRNEDGRLMDAQETFHSRYPNINADTIQAGDAYYGALRKQIEYEYMAARERMRAKSQAGAVVEAAPTQKDGGSRITFLIGNGFDINVGLNTRYSDFYPYFIKNYPDNLLAKNIEGNIEAWSDLELGIGKYTEKISLPDERNFEQYEKDLEECLADYLKEETYKINLREEGRKKQVGLIMLNSITNFYSHFPKIIEQDILRVLPVHPDERKYSFISFNYTDTLELCLKAAKEQDTGRQFRSEDVIHIHGTISDNMVLGVNDKNQIANKNFQRDIEKKELLIKEEINKSYKNSRIQEARAAIDDSSVICVFGMSIGETDKMWWQYIAKWLQCSEARKLVIFARDSEVARNSKYTNKCKRDMTERFKKNGDLIEVWNQVESRIHVEVNADIFSFELV